MSQWSPHFRYKFKVQSPSFLSKNLKIIIQSNSKNKTVNWILTIRYNISPNIH